MGQSGGSPRLTVGVGCMSCGSDITPRHPNTYAHCGACENWIGAAFERGQQVRVRPDWLPMEEGETNIAGERGFVVGINPTGTFEVALRPDGYEGAAPFALYDNELEAI